MSDLSGNHIVGFPMRLLNYCQNKICHHKSNTVKIRHHPLISNVSECEEFLQSFWHVSQMLTRPHLEIAGEK